MTMDYKKMAKELAPVLDFLAFDSFIDIYGCTMFLTPEKVHKDLDFYIE